MSSPNDFSLSAAQHRALAAIADAIIPRGGAFPLGAADVDVAGMLEAHLGLFRSDIRRQIGWLISAWEYGACLQPPFRRFSNLDAAQRIERVRRTYRSKSLARRAPIELLKQLCGFAFGATPQVATAMGFTEGQAVGEQPGRCLSAAPVQQGARLQPRRFPDLHGDMQERVDVCIIGSGAGGAVVAAELAARGLSVLVLEEGDYFNSADFNDLPLRRMLRIYRDQGTTVALGSPPVPVPLGKAVGGTTVINSGTCFRAPDHVLQRWSSEFGLAGYEAADMAPYFDSVEATLNVMPVPWEIIGRNAELFDRGVRALGLNGAPIRRNIRGCRGCGVCAFGCPSDAKQAMHLSYLPRAEQAGARIYARCKALKLQMQGKRVTGVEAEILDGDSTVRGRLRVEADAVVVACGTIHTPGFLSSNGVGKRSGQLGRNLRLHPALSVSASFAEDVFAWRGTLQSYAVDHLMLSDEVMLEVTNPLPNMAINTGKVVGPELKDLLGDFARRAACGLFVSDSSHGRVVQLSRRSRPLMFYSLNRTDTERLLRGMALVSEIFLAAGAHTVHTGLFDLPSIQSTAQLAELRDANRWRSSDLTPTAFHPMGTCRMGPDPQSSVVGLDGQVHGSERLYVADGSLFPTCVGVNPQETIMAFASKIAAGIAAR